MQVCDYPTKVYRAQCSKSYRPPSTFGGHQTKQPRSNTTTHQNHHHDARARKQIRVCRVRVCGIQQHKTQHRARSALTRHTNKHKQHIIHHNCGDDDERVIQQPPSRARKDRQLPQEASPSEAIHFHLHGCITFVVCVAGCTATYMLITSKHQRETTERVLLADRDPNSRCGWNKKTVRPLSLLSPETTVPIAECGPTRRSQRSYRRYARGRSYTTRSTATTSTTRRRSRPGT